MLTTMTDDVGGGIQQKMEDYHNCVEDIHANDFPTAKLVKAFCKEFGFSKEEVECEEVANEKVQLSAEGLCKKLFRQRGMVRYTLVLTQTPGEEGIAKLQLKTEMGGNAKTSRKVEFDMERLEREPEKVLKEFFEEIKQQ